MCRPLSFAIVLVVAGILQTVDAHGFVDQIAIDDRWYTGNRPGSDSPVASPIRTVSDIGPVQLGGSTLEDFLCGRGAAKASVVAPASPGCRFTVNWVGGSDGSTAWIHKTGPIMTYMTSCGPVGCDQFEPTFQTQWFKIAQYGQLENDTSAWYQGQISASKGTYTFTLPQTLPPGGYLVRHELLSLQNAVSSNGAEFYPMCTQIMVDGDGDGSPDVMVSFPYNASDTGIVFDAYSPPVPQYTFPGGPVSSLATSEQSIGPPAPVASASASSSTAATSTTATSSSTATQPTAPAICANINGLAARCLVKPYAAHMSQATRLGRRLLLHKRHH